MQRFTLPSRVCGMTDSRKLGQDRVSLFPSSARFLSFRLSAVTSKPSLSLISTLLFPQHIPPVSEAMQPFPPRNALPTNTLLPLPAKGRLTVMSKVLLIGIFLSAWHIPPLIKPCPTSSYSSLLVVALPVTAVFQCGDKTRWTFHFLESTWTFKGKASSTWLCEESTVVANLNKGFDAEFPKPAVALFAQSLLSLP